MRLWSTWLSNTILNKGHAKAGNGLRLDQMGWVSRHEACCLLLINDLNLVALWDIVLPSKEQRTTPLGSEM